MLHKYADAVNWPSPGAKPASPTIASQSRRQAAPWRSMTSAIWVPAALVAGLFQAWRTALQQRLRAELSLSGAGLVRYLYGAPVAILLAVGYFAVQRLPVPRVSMQFLIFAAGGGLAQIVGTQLLIAAFGYRNFVVG